MHETDKKAIAVATDDRQTENTISTPHSSTSRSITPNQLLEEAEHLPREWALVAVGGNKAPLGKEWQKTPLSLGDLEKAIKDGRFESLIMTSKEGKPFHPPINYWRALGVLSGPRSGGLLFLDHDGASCDALIEELSGKSIDEALPQTLTVTSDRPGRFQAIYQLPEQYWDEIATKKIATGVKDNDGKPEQLEFRWDGCQSIVAGAHPLTGSYRWVPGRSPKNVRLQRRRIG